VLVWYGTPDEVEGVEDEVGERAIRAALDRDARTAVVTETEDQADYVGGEYDVAGVVSLAAIDEQSDGFEWIDSMPELPDPFQNPDELQATVGGYMGKMFKPVGQAIGGYLQTPDNPYGNPEVVFERAGQNTLALSTMLSAQFKGKVVLSENLAGRRYSFYAPQVWMRQRRIYTPTTEIFGTHMKDPYEVKKLNAEIEQGLYGVPNTHLTPWADTPTAHQDIWDNEHEEGSYVINHALPAADLDSEEDLFEAWE
jgi:acrylyl-CoA reductase (NADPH)/3-hydroxypropionyl-CoA dehydratase/3-hydroxypropionyl-CoA synthetase